MAYPASLTSGISYFILVGEILHKFKTVSKFDNNIPITINIYSMNSKQTLGKVFGKQNFNL